MRVLITILFLGSCLLGACASEIKPRLTMEDKSTYNFACESKQSNQDLCCSLWRRGGENGDDERIVDWSTSVRVRGCDTRNDNSAELKMVIDKSVDNGVCRATISRSNDDAYEIIGMK